MFIIKARLYSPLMQKMVEILKWMLLRKIIENPTKPWQSTQPTSKPGNGSLSGVLWK